VYKYKAKLIRAIGGERVSSVILFSQKKTKKTKFFPDEEKRTKVDDI